jgi:Zn finger protein HypA/HybF involved in hydrogenase expression
MPKQRSWSDQQLKNAVVTSTSYREVIKKLCLIPAGGNYVQVKAKIRELALDTSHFTGARWNVGKKYHTKIRPPLAELLIQNSTAQSFKLKKRLFEENIKTAVCELCGWAKMSEDGRIPVELDHINGVHTDNRLENLRILCPNCHSLQPTHRGKNKKVHLARVVEW